MATTTSGATSEAPSAPSTSQALTSEAPSAPSTSQALTSQATTSQLPTSQLPTSQLPTLQAGPLQPPLFTIGNGDVVISILPGPNNEFRVPSTLLSETSRVFAAMLSSRWDYNKRTVEEVLLINGTPSQVKRFELVFDDTGSYLFGKTTSENAHRRRAVALATIEGLVYRSFLEESFCHTKFDYFYPEREWMTVITVNYLCFAMLFELPLEHTTVQKNIQRAKQMVANGYSASFTCFIFRMLGWIDYYGVLCSIRHEFSQLIIHMVPQQEMNENKLAYLRLASILHDRDLLAHLADNDLLFGKSLVSQCGPLEHQYGVKRWFVECDRSLYVLDDLSWDLLDIPRKSENTELSAPAPRAACQRWYEWMLQLRGEKAHRQLFDNLEWSHAGMLDLPLALLTRAGAALDTGFDIANSHPQLTRVEVDDAEKLIKTWTASALDQTRAHVDRASVRGNFKLNYDTFFERSKCPWDYREVESPTEVDDVLLSQLVVDNSLGDLIGHDMVLGSYNHRLMRTSLCDELEEARRNAAA